MIPSPGGCADGCCGEAGGAHGPGTSQSLPQFTQLSAGAPARPPPEPHTLQTDSGSLLPLTGHQPPLLGGGGSSPGVPGVEVGAEMKGPAPDRNQGEDTEAGLLGGQERRWLRLSLARPVPLGALGPAQGGMGSSWREQPSQDSGPGAPVPRAAPSHLLPLGPVLRRQPPQEGTSVLFPAVHLFSTYLWSTYCVPIYGAPAVCWDCSRPWGCHRKQN